MQYINPHINSPLLPGQPHHSCKQKLQNFLLCLLPFHHVIWNHFVLYVQNKIIRTIAGIKKTASCRELCKKLNILPMASDFFLSSLLLILDIFQIQIYTTEAQDTDITYMCQPLT